ncbi:MAG: EF-hand domain-containing protein [Dichotomicrobium sp.]
MTKIVAILPAIFLASAASAQEVQSRFDRLDKNGDGKISWADAYEARSSEFLEMDQNMNGVVEKSELTGRARGFDAFDLDGDGRVQLSEYLESHKGMFTKFDADGTGSLDMQEFEKAQAAVRND